MNSKPKPHRSYALLSTLVTKLYVCGNMNESERRWHIISVAQHTRTLIHFSRFLFCSCKAKIKIFHLNVRQTVRHCNHILYQKINLFLLYDAESVIISTRSICTNIQTSVLYFFPVFSLWWRYLFINNM